MKKTGIIIISSIIVLIVILLESNKSSNINWQKTYNENATNPYDLKVFYDQLKDIYADKKIIKLKKTFYEHLKGRKHFNHLESNTLYLNIDNQYFPDKSSENKLLQYIAKGNIAFISANTFSKTLTDSLGISSLIKDIQISQDTLTATASQKTYTYVPKLKYQQCIFKDSSSITSLGSITYKTPIDTITSKTNFIAIAYQKGWFYLHTQPEVFSNYHLLKMENTEYVNTVLSSIANQIVPNNFGSSKIYFDSNYKTDDDLINSPLRFVKKQKELNLAWQLLLISLAVFLILNAKRKQRVIPIIPKVKNTSLEFVTTVATLYENSDNFQPIIHQKIHIFYKKLRRNYHLVTHTQDKKFIEQLSLKSGYSYNKTKDLIRFIDHLKNRETSSITLLLKLNKEIEEFHQKANAWKN